MSVNVIFLKKKHWENFLKARTNSCLGQKIKGAKTFIICHATNFTVNI